MTITISSQSFSFDKNSMVKVESGGYDLYIEEPGFDKSTEKMEYQFTSKPIHLPSNISARIRTTSLDPCSKIYVDENGKRRLYTYFD